MNVEINGNKVTLSLSDFQNLIQEKGAVVVTAQSQTSAKDVSQEQMITDYLLQRKIPRGIQGFSYTRTAIDYIVANGDTKTMCIYTAVAKAHHTTPSRAERSIRHALEIAYGKDKPTNSNFLFGAADDIRLARLK